MKSAGIIAFAAKRAIRKLQVQRFGERDNNGRPAKTPGNSEQACRGNIGLKYFIPPKNSRGRFPIPALFSDGATRFV
jgi:hypothetical protein